MKSLGSDYSIDSSETEVKDYTTQHQQATFNRRQGTSGISGQIYEIELLMLLLLEGVKKKEDKEVNSFHLATNMEEAGDFDDVVFKYTYNEDGVEKSKVIFLQAKHRENPEKEKITVDKLLSKSDKGDFLLRKYFTSYRRIKQQFSEGERDPIFGSKFEDSNFIIYTNALSTFNSAGNSIKEENINENDFLKISDSQGKRYQLEFNSDRKAEMLSILEDASDCRRLAKELVTSISSGKGIDMQKDIFKSYHLVLAEKVIDKASAKEGKLKNDFLNDDGSLSSEDRKFRRVFFEEAGKVFSKQGDELNQELQSRNIKFSDKFGVGNSKTTLPDDLVTEGEVEEFLSKLKLFVGQPNEAQLGQILKQKMQSIYNVEQYDIDAVFSDVKNKVERWWKEGSDYLTEENKFLQESAKVSIWFDVKKPVDLFTGRKQELGNLHSRIQRSSEKVTVISQMTSISGLGGIGKTELSRQYIHENSKDYDNNIIWINAESEAALIESFNRLAKDKLRISTQGADGKEKDVKSITEEVYKFFSKRKSLFVFDNAEKNEYLNKFLPLRSLAPDANKPYILITSRNQEWERGIEVMDLNELKLEDAIEFVKKGLGIKDDTQDQEIKTLVEKLQRFPLAIQQAIAYIEDQGVIGEFSIDNYLEEYEKKTKDLLDSEVFKGIDNDYAKTTFTTWKITIDKIASDSEHGQLALKILDAIAYFAPESINREMFLDLADGDERKLSSAVRLLVKYSMINGKQKQSVLSIHRLVQEVTRLKLKEEGKEEESLKEALKLVEGNLKKENLDHAVSAWNHASKYEELVKEFSKLSSKVINKLNEVMRYEEAYLFGTEALKLLESVLEKDHPDTLSTKDNIAWVLSNQGKYEEALEAYKELYEKSREIFGEDHRLTLSIKNNIAIMLYKQGKYEEALQAYEEIYEKTKEIFGEDHLDTLAVKNNIAGVLFKQEKYEEALEAYKELYEKTKEISGEDHQDVLTVRNNIAGVLFKQEKYEEALEAYEEIYEKKKEIFGEDHPDTLSTKDNIAWVLSNQGKYEEALEAYKELYEKSREIFGEDHRLTLAVKNHIAAVLEKQGKHADALKIFQEVYDRRKKILGPDHRDTLATQSSIEILKRKQDKNEEVFSAEECLPNISSGSSSRRKREAQECELSWDDVDRFNEEKEEIRDFSKIKINSEKFIDHIKSESMSEAKLAQLVQLADKVPVIGESQGLVGKLINNQKIINHLAKVGRISGMVMHEMMAKNALGAFLNGDYTGVAINIGFIAGGQGLAKVAEAASVKGVEMIADGKLLLGRSLRLASPFLARSASAFVVYDLVNQVKEFRAGNKDALVGVVGDSIYLGVDAAEVGIEVAEVFELFEGVSSVTGPIGAAIGAVVFVGTDIYMAVKRVDNIDKVIHLTGEEKFIEGLRAFIGMQPGQYIEELINEKQVNNKLVNQAIEFLKQHNEIKRYVFSAAKFIPDPSNYTEICESRKSRYEVAGVSNVQKECRVEFGSKIQEDLNSAISLSEMISGIVWSEAKPDSPSTGQLFCAPTKIGVMSNEKAYLCNNAIGVDYTPNTGNDTLINLGEGQDFAVGFADSPNIFVVNDGRKSYIGGASNDRFVLGGGNIRGTLDGGNGIDEVDLENFAIAEKFVQVKLGSNGNISYANNTLLLQNINKISARKNKKDEITCAYDTKYVDGQGGESSNSLDVVTIPNNRTHFYEMEIMVRSHTNITNSASSGNFRYVISSKEKGESSISIYGGGRHSFFFNYTLREIDTVSFSDSNVNNETTIKFSFLPDATQTSILYTSNVNGTSYELSDGTAIVVGKNNLYAMQNSNESVDEIVRDYPATTNRLKMSFFVLASNEMIAVGHGNHDVLHNDPEHKSHLVGNGGENVYIIDSETDNVPEVVIHDVDEENSIDTIDLRSIVKKAKDNCELQVMRSENDLLLRATVGEQKDEYFTVRLKDGVERYNKTHVVVENTPMRISVDKNEWSLKPQPLMFEKDKETIVITDQDVEKGTEIVTPRKGGKYKFVRDNNNGLMITNVFDLAITKGDFCSIILSKFYEIPKMATLSVKFADKEIVLKDHHEQISTARYINTLAKEYNDRVYNDVFNHSAGVMMLSDQPVMHSGQHIRNRRMVSGSAKPSLWINDLFGWVKSSIGGLLSFKPEKTSSTASSISQVDKQFAKASVSSGSSNGNFDNEEIIKHKLEFKENIPNSTSTTPPSGGTGKKQESNSFTSRDFFRDNVNYVNANLKQMHERQMPVKFEPKGGNKTLEMGDYYLSQADFNGTIMLLDLFIRKFTGQRFISSEDQSVSLLEAQSYALNITEKFEMLLTHTARSCGIQGNNLNFNPITVQSTTAGHLRNGKFSEISETLYESTKETCPEFKQIGKFLVQLKNHLNDVLAEKEIVLLLNKQKVEDFKKSDQPMSTSRKAVTAEISDEPKTFLNGTSVAKGIGNAYGLYT